MPLPASAADRGGRRWDPARASTADPVSSIRHETVQQAGPAGGFERVVAAAARAVRGIPRRHVPGLLETLAAVVSDDGRALRARKLHVGSLSRPFRRAC